jgi:hypothetical protein
MPKAPPSNGAAAASSKARALKYIPRTADLQRSSGSALAKGKSKAKSVLKDVHDLIKGELTGFSCSVELTSASDYLPGAVQVERYAEVNAGHFTVC